MANELAGLFTTPEEIRQARIQKIDDAETALLGGNLLNQVAAAGSLSGKRIGERLGGMLGLQTQEEFKAGQMNNMFKALQDPNLTPVQSDAILQSMAQMSPKGMVASDLLRQREDAKQEKASAKELAAQKKAMRESAASYIGKLEIPNAELMSKGVLLGEFSIKDAMDFVKPKEGWTMLDQATSESLYGPGAVVQVGTDNQHKVLKAGEKPAELQNVRTMLDPNGTPVQVGTVGGKSAIATPDGIKVTSLDGFTPMANITKTSSYDDSVGSAMTLASKMKLPEKVQQLEEIKTTQMLFDTAKGPDGQFQPNSQALNQLEINLTSLSRNGRFSMAQLEQAVGDRAIAERISSSIANLLRGGLTAEKAAQIEEVIRNTEGLIRQQYQSAFDRFKSFKNPNLADSEAAAGWDAAIGAYDLSGSGVAPNAAALEYYNQAKGVTTNAE